MPIADQTRPVIKDHFDAVLSVLESGMGTTPVGEWQRPEDLDNRFDDPPYLLVRIFPSADQFDGPLNDTQADIIVRIEVIGVGNTQGQALNITDRARQLMQPSSLSIPNRYVQSLTFMVVSGGISRDDDLPIPFHDSVDLWELQTTPE